MASAYGAGSHSAAGASGKSAYGASGGSAAKQPQGGGGFLHDVMSHVPHPVMTALSALDYPRSVVASGILHGVDALKGQAPPHSFGYDVSHHLGMGDVLASTDLGRKIGGTAGGWTGRLLGFMGDVGADPFSYVGAIGGGSITKGSNDLFKVARAEEAAGHLAEADRFTQMGQKLLKGGTGALDSAEKADAVARGVRIGPRLHVPFGPETEGTAGIEGTGSKILKPRLPTDVLSFGKAKVRNLAGRTLGPTFENIDRVNAPVLRKLLREGAPAEARGAHATLEGASVWRGAQQAAATDVTGRVNQALAEMGGRELKPHLHDVVAHLGGDAKATERLTQAGVDTARLGALKSDIMDYVGRQGGKPENVEKIFAEAAKKAPDGESAVRASAAKIGRQIADNGLHDHLIANGLPIKLMEKAQPIADQIEHATNTLHDIVNQKAENGIAKADEFARSTIENGGGSLDTNEGRILHPKVFGGTDTGHMVPIDGFTKTVAPKDFSGQSVRDFIDKNKMELARDQAHVGSWVNPKTGNIELDLVQKVNSGEADALKMAQTHGPSQKAIFDMTSGNDVPVWPKVPNEPGYDSLVERGMAKLDKPGVSGMSRETVAGSPGIVYRDQNGKALGRIWFDSAEAGGAPNIDVIPGARGKGIATKLGREALDKKLTTPEAIMRTQKTAQGAAFVRSLGLEKPPKLPNIDKQIAAAVAAGHDPVKAALLHPEVGKAFEQALGTSMQKALPPEFVSLGDKLSGTLKGMGAPPWVAEGLKSTKAFAAPGGASKFWHFYDQGLRAFKDMILLAPGKGVRHVYSGLFGMSLGHVSPESMFHDAGVLRRIAKGTATEEEKGLFARFNRLVETHTVAGDLPGEVAGVSGLPALRGNVSKALHYIPEKNWSLQAKAIDPMRFSMFSDAVRRGASDTEAAMKVKTLLFSPANMSAGEQLWARRLVPFYSFMRTQFPMALQNMAEQPGKFVNLVSAFHNLAGSKAPPGVAVPGFTSEEGKVFTGLREGGGQPIFGAPDLPAFKMDDVLSRGIVSELSPVLGLIQAQQTDTNPFSGAQFKGAVPHPFKGAGTMSGKNLYSLETIMPLLQNFEKLAPTQDKYKEARMANIIKLLLGYNTQSVTDAMSKAAPLTTGGTSAYGAARRK